MIYVNSLASMLTRRSERFRVINGANARATSEPKSKLANSNTYYCSRSNKQQMVA
jgi:hypothetical protein